MTILKFEDLICWQKSQTLAVDIYKKFKDLADRDFKSQICRAVVSISNNLAEGIERGTDLEKRRFSRIALGSCSEVKSMLYLANKLEYISDSVAEQLIEQASEVSRITIGFIKSLKIK